MKKILLFFLCFTSVPAFSEQACEYDNIVRELHANCGGINAELQRIKKFGIANVAITGVGTDAATGAVVAGIKKKDFDKKAEELAAQLKDKQMSDQDFIKFMYSVARYREQKKDFDDMCNLKHHYENKAKQLGHVRTGLMAGNTATAVAGTVISAKNKNDSKTIQEKIQQCLDTINNNQQKIGQSMVDCGTEQYKKLKDVVSSCRSLSTENMEKVQKRNQVSAIVSGVNIGTGLAGTITSAVANKNEYDKKTKNLNTAANVLAGTSAVASGVSTAFNATTLKAINNNLKASENCEGALDRL